MTPLKPYNINAISHRTECILNVIFFMMALCCILPILLVVIVSFSSQQSIFLRGYTFFPAEFSPEAYQYFFKLGDQIIRSYGVTLFVSAFGTFFSLAVMAPFAYVLSRPDYAYRKFFTMALLIIMMFLRYRTQLHYQYTVFALGQFHRRTDFSYGAQSVLYYYLAYVL